ncbi:MAG: hypothetical protein V9G19_03685 [Tetrasphaera sp.]
MPAQTATGSATIPPSSPIAASTPIGAATSVRTDSVRTNAELYSGAPEVGLMPGERQLYQVNFAPRLLAPHLLTLLTVTDKRIVVRHPNTIFGIFPLGYVVSSAPHSSVEQITSGMHLRSRNILIGCSALLVMCYLLKEVWTYHWYGMTQATPLLISLGALVVGVGFLLTGKRVGITIHTGGSAMFALARGNQLRDVQASAHVVNRLLLEVEQSRGLG